MKEKCNSQDPLVNNEKLLFPAHCSYVCARKLLMKIMWQVMSHTSIMWPQYSLENQSLLFLRSICINFSTRGTPKNILLIQLPTLPTKPHDIFHILSLLYLLYLKNKNAFRRVTSKYITVRDQRGSSTLLRVASGLKLKHVSSNDLLSNLSVLMTLLAEIFLEFAIFEWECKNRGAIRNLG